MPDCAHVMHGKALCWPIITFLCSPPVHYASVNTRFGITRNCKCIGNKVGKPPLNIGPVMKGCNCCNCTVLYLKFLSMKVDNGTDIKRGLNKVVFCLVRPVSLYSFQIPMAAVL